jgi:phosphoglycolate phosphatase
VEAPLHILFWDIDGTLIRTRRAGLLAFDEACRQAIGVEAIDWERIDTRGFTDQHIAGRVLEAYGHPVEPAAIVRLLALYEECLPSWLDRRGGHTLPGVVEILERLKPRKDVLPVLLTGNTRGGARAKLEHHGLLGYFHGPNGDSPPFGAFAEDGVQRDAIARAALALAERTVGAVAVERCTVIGDTPHDVSCGKAIGVRTVSVATGGYALEELRTCEPWKLWERLPAPAEFERELGL